MSNKSGSGVGRAVQADWEGRELIESLKINVRRIYDFVLNFGE